MLSSYARASCLKSPRQATAIAAASGRSAARPLSSSRAVAHDAHDAHDAAALARLMRDVDTALLHRAATEPKAGEIATGIKGHVQSPVSSETVPYDGELDGEHDVPSRWERRSPSARFGSKRVGSVQLPKELEERVMRLVQASDKNILRQDANYLLTLYSSRSASPLTSQPASRAPPPGRDVLAHLAAIMPGRYAVIYNVMLETRRRLEGDLPPGSKRGEGSNEGENVGWDEKGWMPHSVMEWGAKTGEGLWATQSAFASEAFSSNQSLESPIKYYTGRDRSSHTLGIASELAKDSAVLGDLKPLWTSKSAAKGKARDPEGRHDPSHALALSAFHLSTLPTPRDRRDLLRDIWQSGAEVIVLIDHGTPGGFAVIAEAREFLLELGRKEVRRFASDREASTGWPREVRAQKRGEVLQLGRQTLYAEAWEGEEVEDADEQGVSDAGRGCHVVAPCPHDGPCPLHHALSYFPSRAHPVGNVPTSVCHFSQRLQRPPFVRSIKKSKQGEEDVKYSYVVIRRGPRPSFESIARAESELGVGTGEAVDVERMWRARAALGKTGVLDKLRGAEAKPELRTLHEVGTEAAHAVELADETSPAAAVPAPVAPEETSNSAEVAQAMRLEAYHWPRLVFSPLKKGGHVYADACCPTGNIERMSLPKSLGRQPYQDARKSNWGDLYPHAPRKPPTVRIAPMTVEEIKANGGKQGEGAKKIRKKWELDKYELKKVERRERALQKAMVAQAAELGIGPEAVVGAGSWRQRRPRGKGGLEDVDWEWTGEGGTDAREGLEGKLARPRRRARGDVWTTEFEIPVR